MKWFLKKAGLNTVYGPAEESVLEAWAADARIAPEDFVSADRLTWKPAPELDALKMDWMVFPSSGETLGPFHPLALRQLIQDGVINADTPARSRKTGQTTTAAGVLLPFLMAGVIAEDAERQAELESARRRAAEAEERAAQAEKRAATLEADLQAAREQAERLGTQLDQAAREASARAEEERQKALAAESAKSAALEEIATLRAELDKVRADMAARERELAELSAALNDARQRLEAQAEELQQARSAAEAGRAQVEKAMAEATAAQRELAAVRAELQKWKDLYEQAMMECSRLKASLREKKPSEEEWAPKAQLEAAQRRIEHLERVYRQTLSMLQQELAARSGGKAPPPPERLQRRDIA